MCEYDTHAAVQKRDGADCPTMIKNYRSYFWPRISSKAWLVFSMPFLLAYSTIAPYCSFVKQTGIVRLFIIALWDTSNYMIWRARRFLFVLI